MSKPSTKKAVEEAREELKHADMGKFDRALRALLKVSGSEKKGARARVKRVKRVSNQKLAGDV